jgi:hypothetical protein
MSRTLSMMYMFNPFTTNLQHINILFIKYLLIGVDDGLPRGTVSLCYRSTFSSLRQREHMVVIVMWWPLSY